jgi:5-(carboxyamino)imidazole ribonucleotide mutase
MGIPRERAMGGSRESLINRHKKQEMTDKNPVVGIIMGSDSDLPTMQAAIAICEQFDVKCEVAIVSAHRTPERMVNYAQTACDRGIKVIIAGAGGAAHLPGMVASLTPLPVIGVPVTTRTLQGVDSLYSIVQMPAGIPVATVAIGNATNAGLLAVQILASSDSKLLEKVKQYRQNLSESVLSKQEKLEKLGYKQYLEEM